MKTVGVCDRCEKVEVRPGWLSSNCQRCGFPLCEECHGRYGQCQSCDDADARHREIGFLVEQIASVYPVQLCADVHSVWLTDENALDALRALATKLGITDEKGATR